MGSHVLLKNGHLVPGGDAPELPRADLLIRDGVIAALGPGLSDPAAELIDATGLVVLPGFVDAHRHVWQAPLRGVGADMTLVEYFRAVINPSLAVYQPEDARLATTLGAAEALDAGITTMFDWSNTVVSPAFADVVVESYDAVGIRAVVGHPDPHSAADVARLVNDTGTVTGGLAILGPVRGSWEDTRRQLRLAREIGAVVSMHAQGGGQDSAVSELFRAGLLGADLNLIHLNDVTDDEAKMLVDAGAGTTVTPLVEATMGHGMSPYGRLRDNGGRVALGVDVVVNSVPDLFEPLRDTLRTERLRTGTMRPAASVLPAATIDSARAIGLADQIGTLEVGKRADIVLLDGLAHLTGAGSVAGAVVTSAGPANVHTVLVNGKLVKRDGRLLQHNLAELRAAATNLARRVLFSG